MSKFNKKPAAIISAILCFCIIFSFTACSESKKTSNDDNKKLSIVCTIFPVYDWVKQILGNNSEDAQYNQIISFKQMNRKQ